MSCMRDWVLTEPLIERINEKQIVSDSCAIYELDLYKANKVHRFHFINIYRQIDSSESRFTSNNDERDHWWFNNYDSNRIIQLQGVNCLKCGQYQCAQSNPKWKILCKCPDHVDYMIHVGHPLYLINN